MKDNDLLVTELYRDPSNDPITAISVYLTPKTSKLIVIISYFWYFEIQSGSIRVVTLIAATLHLFVL
jgi:hypothetical protein